MKKPTDRSTAKEILYYFSLIGQLGLIMLANIFVGIGLYYLISLSGFKNAFLFIILIILGVLSGFWSVFKILMKK